MTILKVKQSNGEIVNIPFGVGADGKSAYEQAQEGGYTGTEQEFINILGNINIIDIIQENLNTHIEDKNNPHNVTAEQIGAVSVDRTINNKALNENISLSASDIGAVPTTRTINNKTLSENISLTANDVGADSQGSATQVQNDLNSHKQDFENPHRVTTTQIGAVPTGRTINNKALTSDITLTASDVGADSSGSANQVQNNLNSHKQDFENPHNVTAEQIGAVSVDRTINGMDLNNDILLEAHHVGAYPNNSGLTLEDDLYAHIENQNNPHQVTISQLGSGTFSGQVSANATAMATLGTAQVRNIYAGTSDMTAGVTELPTGSIYFVYEA